MGDLEPGRSQFHKSWVLGNRANFATEYGLLAIYIYIYIYRDVLGFGHLSGIVECEIL